MKHTTHDTFFEALKAQLPGIKTQAQLTAFMAAFESFRETMNGILTGNKEKEEQARKALDTAFKICHQATDISDMLRDVPEAATSKTAEDRRKPRAEFAEHDVQRGLLAELGEITSLLDLTVWWKASRSRIDHVVSPALRDPLLDLVRERRAKLSADG
jgi:hypothetical protein